MRNPTNLDVTNVLYECLIVPIVELVDKHIDRFFKRGDATAYLVQLGTVDPAYVSGDPKVKFDRDAELSGKTYKPLASYTPAANDRVVLMRCGKASWVILGKLV